jgi:hypothetical protein
MNGFYNIFCNFAHQKKNISGILLHLLNKMGQLQERYKNYREPQKYMEAGVYPYFRAITSKQGTEVTEMEGHKVLMFGSNAYTGLTYRSSSNRGCA